MSNREQYIARRCRSWVDEKHGLSSGMANDVSKTELWITRKCRSQVAEEDGLQRDDGNRTEMDGKWE